MKKDLCIPNKVRQSNILRLGRPCRKYPQSSKAIFLDMWTMSIGRVWHQKFILLVTFAKSGTGLGHLHLVQTEGNEDTVCYWEPRPSSTGLIFETFTIISDDSVHQCKNVEVVWKEHSRWDIFMKNTLAAPLDFLVWKSLTDYYQRFFPF